MRLKKEHTIVGIWVDPRNDSVHSVWVPKAGISFFCYFGMTIEKFTERCSDLAANGGYCLQDVTIYNDSFS